MSNTSRITGFQWNEGNREKNWILHKVSNNECEELFFHEPFVLPDPKHSLKETRYYALGKTDAGRMLFVSFTARKGLIRVISARDANKKEKQQYEKEKEKNSSISH